MQRNFRAAPKAADPLRIGNSHVFGHGVDKRKSNCPNVENATNGNAMIIRVFSILGSSGNPALSTII